MYSCNLRGAVTQRLGEMHVTSSIFFFIQKTIFFHMWPTKINSGSGKYTPFYWRSFQNVLLRGAMVWCLGKGAMRVEWDKETDWDNRNHMWTQRYQTSRVSHTHLCWDTLTSSGETTSAWPRKRWKRIYFSSLLFAVSRCLARHMHSVPDGDDREKCTQDFSHIACHKMSLGFIMLLLHAAYCL